MSGASMDVLYATMAFPAPSEAFAGVEVRALRRLGVRVRVRALRPAHRMTRELLQDWELEGTDVTQWSAATLPRAAVFVLRHPWMSLRTAGWLVRQTWNRPAVAWRALVLLPRCLEIFADCLRHPPDVLHLFWGHYPATIGYLALNWLPRTHVSTSLGAYDLLLHYAPGLDIARRAHSVWTQAACNRAALSQAGIATDRMRVLVRGVDTSLPDQRAPGQPRNSIVVVARLEENKGVDDAIRAFATIARLHPGVRLEILGEGPQLPVLQRLASSLGVDDRVDLRGACAHSEVYAALRRSSVFLLLTRNPSERLPNALKEAMACGCLCIVTRTPGIEEIAAAWASPRIVEQGDWRAAGRHLHEVLARPEAFEAEREAGQRFARDRLDAAVAARDRLAVWRQAGSACAA